MNLFLLKRFSLLLLVIVIVLSFGCSKKVATPPPPPPVAPPPPPPPAPGVTLSADRTAITAGQSVTLTYTSTNAAAVSISGVGPVTPAASGTRQVSPTTTTNYTATATGPGGSATSPGVGITVTAAAAPPPPPPPDKPVTAPVTRTLDQIFTQTMVPILFDYDKSTIRADEERKLLNSAAWLKQNPTVRFTIEGHADERGSQEFNIALGDERAAAVKKFLAGQGIGENRINTVSFGEERPTCRDQNENCFQQNRRAAFVRIP